MHRREFGPRYFGDQLGYNHAVLLESPQRWLLLAGHEARDLVQPRIVTTDLATTTARRARDGQRVTGSVVPGGRDARRATTPPPTITWWPGPPVGSACRG
jgi:hypothetical protein